MRIIRGRAFVRAWEPRHGEAVGTAALVGFAEIDGDVDDEVIHGMALLQGTASVMLTATGTRMVPEDDIRASGVDDLLRSSEWPRPDLLTGMDGGGILVRRTRVPCEKGATFIIVGLISTNTLRDQTMVDLAGDLAGVVIVDGQACARHLDTNGCTLSQVLGLPIWGWMDRKWGIRSTMALDVIDACTRYDQLLAGHAEHEPGEMERLSRGPAGWVLNAGRSDPKYQRFRALWIERHGLTRWDGYETAEDQDETSRRAEDIVREIMEA